MSMDAKEIFLNDSMPPPGLVIPPGMTWNELPADGEILEFWGCFIDKTDTDDGSSDRWTELQYWFMLDSDPDHDDSLPLADENRGMFGKQMRLVYTIGHSLVWHRHPDGCGKGVRYPGSEFPSRTPENPESLVPCKICRPAEWGQFPEKDFCLEVAWYSYTACRTPAQVITALSRCAKCWDRPHEGGRCRRCGCASYSGLLTTPGRTLVEQVKDRDPELAQAAVRTKRF